MAKQNKNKNTKFNLSKRIGKTVEIGTEIENILEYYNLDDKMEELKILNVWKECVGDSISKYTTPVGLRDNKLLITAEDATWRFELASRKNEIIHKLNTYLQKKEIKEIVFI